LDARDNIWKAYVYTETSRASHGMLVLKAGNTKVTEVRQEADLLLATFFPVPPELADRDDTSVKPRLVTKKGLEGARHQILARGTKQISTNTHAQLSSSRGSVKKRTKVSSRHDGSQKLYSRETIRSTS
jgi:hypothetical protein